MIAAETYGGHLNNQVFFMKHTFDIREKNYEFFFTFGANPSFKSVKYNLS
jgi:hypothetical protein